MYFGQTRPMEVYERQIKYLDYMENGIRIKGAGFVKLERQDNQCSINLQVNSLYRKDRFTRPFLLVDEQGEQELCRLQLADGGIKLHLDALDCDNLDGHGLRYEQLIGFRIPISEGKEICCRLEEPLQRPVRSSRLKNEEVNQSLEASEVIPLSEIVPKVENSGLEELLLPNSGIADLEPWEEPKRTADPKLCAELLCPVEVRHGAELQEAVKLELQREVSVSIKDEKWEQLWSIYPHKCPFSDDREYLAVGPGDFVVLSEQNYKLVNNSFLLHGYYNHHHLILTRIRERNRMCYYIGVPGNFYEREKRTAIMFGFKSFECAVEPAEEGDFGYYMIPVEL